MLSCYSLILLTCAISLIAAANFTTYTYKSIGNLDITADVYMPNITSCSKVPVVFAIHGGAYIIGSKDGGVSPQELEEILSRGWAVVTVNYRLAPGALLDEILGDLQDAYTWMIDDLANIEPIDINRIAVFGGSAGGGLALINGYRLTPRPVVVIAFYPAYANFTEITCYNPDVQLNTLLLAEVDALRKQQITEFNFGPGTRLSVFMTFSRNQKIGWLLSTLNPDEPVDIILQRLIDYSPVYNVDKEHPPTYLAHGLADTQVPYNQSMQMAAQLAQNNITYKLDLVPNADHLFDTGNVTTEFWETHILPAFDFAAQYLN